VLGATPPIRNRGEIAASGSMVSHYTPETAVHVVTQDEVAASAVRQFASGAEVGILAMHPPTDLPAEIVVLVSPADIDDYARVLYARLREADARGITHLYVVPPPEVGLGAAITDRLHRAQT
jgi:L-threonylcarbamoyladenylate synthase